MGKAGQFHGLVPIINSIWKYLLLNNCFERLLDSHDECVDVEVRKAKIPNFVRIRKVL